MKVNEIKKTVEQVVRVEYISEDGHVFYNKEECEKYEESALFAVSNMLKRLNTRELSVYDLLDEGCDEALVEIFDIQTDKDKENLQRYLYLKSIKNGGVEKYVRDNINANFKDITIGHEVIIWWNYDCDYSYTYGDGSMEGYFNHLRKRWTKFITPETTEN